MTGTWTNVGNSQATSGSFTLNDRAWGFVDGILLPPSEATITFHFTQAREMTETFVVHPSVNEIRIPYRGPREPTVVSTTPGLRVTFLPITVRSSPMPKEREVNKVDWKKEGF